MSSDIFKNVDKNVDVENVEIFKRSKFKYLSTKNSFDCTGTFYMLQIIYFSNIMLIVKRHIFNDKCVMYLIYDEIEWYGVRESIIAFSDVSGFYELSVFLGVDGGEEEDSFEEAISTLKNLWLGVVPFTLLVRLIFGLQDLRCDTWPVVFVLSINVLRQCLHAIIFFCFNSSKR